MSQLLQRLALVAFRRYRAVFAVFAVLVMLSVLLALHLDFDTDVLNLLPRDDPVVQTFRETLEEFGSVDLLLVVVKIPPGAPVEPYESFADRLGEELGKVELLDYVDYRVGEIDELVKTFIPKSILFLDAEGRQRVGELLDEEAVRQRARELKRMIATPQAMALKQLIVLDPLGLSEVFLDRLGKPPGALSVDLSGGYYLSRDHQRLLLIAKPSGPAQEVEFDRRVVAAVEAAVTRARHDWPKAAGADAGPPPEVVLGGRYLTALDDAALIKGDVVINLCTSMIGVLLLFLFAFRRFGPLLYAFVPLTAGIVLAFGFCALALGSLNSTTSGVAALLIGLAIDFVIVSYGRFVEERNRGATLPRALRRMLGSSGKAVVVGGVTSGATFYAFLVTGFAGLQQMGLLAGTGILLCMVAVLFLLPAMLGWSEAHHRRRETRPHLYLHGFGVTHLMDLCLRWPRSALAGGLVVTVLAAVAAARLEFQDSVRELRSPHNRGVRALQDVSDHFGAGFNSMSLVVDGTTLDEVLERTDQAAAGAQRLVDDGVLEGIDAITALVPPPEQQREALSWLDEERRVGHGGPEVRARLADALSREGLRAEAFAPGLDLLEQALSVQDPIRLDDFAKSKRTERLLERYLRRADHGWKSVIKLFPPAGEWKREPPPETLQLAAELGPHVELTGVNVVSRTLRERAESDAWVAALLGLVLVAAILWLDYRSLRDCLLSLAPLGVGILWMLGSMVALGIHLNFLNIFVSTMIIGIGVDYGVHVLHRYREAIRDSPDRVEGSLQETGKAIVMAALSTVVGFGSMSLSRYPGLRSMGLVAILGALTTALVSITLLPAYLAWRRR